MYEISFDSGLYYLQSRYYDPAVGRFINADAFASTGQGFIGCNMYAYCANNPVNYKDVYGEYAVPFREQYQEYLLQEAQEKYNSSTVNVYMEGEGTPIDGMINVCFYHPTDDTAITNINISDSLSISNPYEQEAVLKVVVESPYYSYEEFGSIDFMQAQWTAHNVAYAFATSGAFGEKIASRLSGSNEPAVSASVLDIRSKNNILKRSKVIYYVLEILDIMSW